MKLLNALLNTRSWAFLHNNLQVIVLKYTAQWITSFS